uniref:C2H2-type domain-containing protein n=1 Tax=Graphocephala atropunctata TaxID=36148 RepID=A0A1B6M1J2_9HEMI
MFWVWKRSRLTDTAVAFFNSINNNHTGASAGGSKKTGYNKLAAGDDNTAADATNANLNQTNMTTPLTTTETGETSESSSASDFELEDDDFSDDSDADEALTCNVCDRSFSTLRLLAQHQQKKRHFGCSACDSLFQTLMALEHHKEEFEHWSGDETMLVHNKPSDDSSEETSEEMERLL